MIGQATRAHAALLLIGAMDDLPSDGVVDLVLGETGWPGPR